MKKQTHSSESIMARSLSAPFFQSNAYIRKKQWHVFFGKAGRGLTHIERDSAIVVHGNSKPCVLSTRCRDEPTSRDATISNKPFTKTAVIYTSRRTWAPCAGY